MLVYNVRSAPAASFLNLPKFHLHAQSGGYSLMFRLSLLLFPLAFVAMAAKPTDYSTDMVMIEGGQVRQTLRLSVSGQKSRLEGMTAGQFGRMATIARKDKGVTWTLFLDQRQYTEAPLTAGSQSGKPDLSNLDLSNLKKENLGRETVLGYPCTKVRVTMGKLPNGQPLLATAWVAESLDLPLRTEAMGITQENRNLKIGPQPASLFEIPAGFVKTNAPGMPAGGPGMAAAGAAAGRVADNARGTLTGQAAGARQAVERVAGRYGGKNVPAAVQTAVSGGPAWRLNTNYPGGDYRSIDMATADPTACKAACDKDAPCKAWTLVKPGEPGGMGYCWLKDTIPPATSEDCCISSLKGAAGGSGGSQASKYQLEMNVNRNGADFHDFAPARASADVCAEACAKDSRCRTWTWVKGELEPPVGHCWLKHSAPEPTPDDCCVSGVKR
jgi:hypothetical protein